MIISDHHINKLLITVNIKIQTVLENKKYSTYYSFYMFIYIILKLDILHNKYFYFLYLSNILIAGLLHCNRVFLHCGVIMFT